MFIVTHFSCPDVFLYLLRNVRPYSGDLVQLTFFVNLVDFFREAFQDLNNTIICPDLKRILSLNFEYLGNLSKYLCYGDTILNYFSLPSAFSVALMDRCYTVALFYKYPCPGGQ